MQPLGHAAADRDDGLAGVLRPRERLHHRLRPRQLIGGRRKYGIGVGDLIGMDQRLLPSKPMSSRLAALGAEAGCVADVVEGAIEHGAGMGAAGNDDGRKGGGECRPARPDAGVQRCGEIVGAGDQAWRRQSHRRSPTR